MSCTILLCENVQLHEKLALDKNGSKYYLWYHGSDGHSVCSRDFDTYEQAFSVFTEMSDYMGSGRYTQEERRDILKAK